MENKRGDASSFNVILFLVIGVIVAGSLIWYFSSSFSSATAQIKISKNSVDTFIGNCAKSCTSETSFDFCKTDQPIIFYDAKENKQTKQFATCNAVAKGLSVDNGKPSDGAAVKTRWGVEVDECPGLCKDVPVPPVVQPTEQQKAADASASREKAISRCTNKEIGIICNVDQSGTVQAFTGTCKDVSGTKMCVA